MMALDCTRKGRITSSRWNESGRNNQHGGEKNKYRKCKVKQETWGLKLQNKTWNNKNGNDDTRKKRGKNNSQKSVTQEKRLNQWQWFSWSEEHFYGLQASSGNFHMASHELRPKVSVISHRCAQLGQTIVYYTQKLWLPHTLLFTETSNMSSFIPTLRLEIL